VNYPFKSTDVQYTAPSETCTHTVKHTTLSMSVCQSSSHANVMGLILMSTLYWWKPPLLGRSLWIHVNIDRHMFMSVCPSGTQRWPGYQSGMRSKDNQLLGENYTYINHHNHIDSGFRSIIIWLEDSMRMNHIYDVVVKINPAPVQHFSKRHNHLLTKIVSPLNITWLIERIISKLW